MDGGASALDEEILPIQHAPVEKGADEFPALLIVLESLERLKSMRFGEVQDIIPNVRALFEELQREADADPKLEGARTEISTLTHNFKRIAGNVNQSASILQGLMADLSPQLGLLVDLFYGEDAAPRTELSKENKKEVKRCCKIISKALKSESETLRVCRNEIVDNNVATHGVELVLSDKQTALRIRNYKAAKIGGALGFVGMGAAGAVAISTPYLGAAG